MLEIQRKKANAVSKTIGLYWEGKDLKEAEEAAFHPLCGAYVAWANGGGGKGAYNFNV